jgi:glucose/arabinose dehydrogenase
MKINRIQSVSAVAMLGLAAWSAKIVRGNANPTNVLTGSAAFASYKTEKPGDWHQITVADLPKPFATASSSNASKVIPRPANAWPKAPAGFKVDLYASEENAPREIRTAPNGDFFLAESYTGDVVILRGMGANGKPQQRSVFATGLRQPFGMAFYPSGDNPQWLYVGDTNAVLRFPYHSGDLKATGPAQTIVAELPAGGGHWTRDLAFSPDGKHLFVGVGSASNVNDPDKSPAEHHRANILEFTPDGKFEEVYASGIRNPVGIAVNPATGELWCSVNERDALGDNLVPDYITHVQEHGFYGWPWYYMGSNQDPRLEGTHPELKGHVLVPDVLLQPHNASLELTFYEGSQFPAEYKGDAFAAEHGSWNKSARAGYEVVRVPLDNGHAKGIYEDFLTGFVTSSGEVWGRPVGVAVGHDGALYVTDDGSRSVWRVSYTGK